MPFRFALSTLLVLLTLQAQAAEKNRIVVLPMGASNEKLRAVAESLAEQVLTELGKHEALEVIGASDVQTLVGLERQKQLQGCSEANGSCLAELASALGAPWVVTGNVAQLGKSMRVDLKLIRAVDGKVVFRDGQNFKDESEVFDAVTSIVSRLVKKVDLKPARKEPVTRPVEPRPEPKPQPVDAPVVVAVTPAPVEPVGVVAEPAAPLALRIAPWAVVGAGAVSVAVGGVLVGLGFGVRGQIPSGTVTTLQARDAWTKVVVGATLGGVGILAAAGGLSWWLLGKPAGGEKVTFSFGPESIVVSGAF